MKTLILTLLLSATITPAQIRVVAYNIKHGRGMDGQVDLARTAEVLKKLNPDLIALQEVDKNCTRSGNTAEAAELGKLLKMNHAFGKFMNFQGGEYGLAVLSKYPILETTRHQLPEGAEPRCALEILVEPPDTTTALSFVSIHNDWTGSNYRVPQVEALIKALQDRKHPVVLAGDFNTQPQGPSIKLLKQAGWRLDRKAGQKTFPSVAPQKEIDYFIVKGLPPLTTKVIEEKVASDHRPIQAEIPAW